jgi:hypothetical protein
MPRLHPVPAVPAAALAQRVLDVWITNDSTGLENELKQILYQTRPSKTTTDPVGIESERHELIRAIAKSMDRDRKTWSGAAGEPRFGVWVNLLRHLSAGDSASPGSPN